MVIRRVLAATAAVASLTCAQGNAGVLLVGGSGSPSDPPSLALGPAGEGSSAVFVATGGFLELRKKGLKVMSFGDDAITLPQVQSNGDVNVREAISVRGVPQWQLWDVDTFDTPTTGLWSVNTRNNACFAPSDSFLGGPCVFAGTTTSRNYTGLPHHAQIRLRCRVHFFDEWAGESLFVSIGGVKVWSQSYEWCSGVRAWKCRGIDSCGRESPDRLSVKVEVTVLHTTPELDVAFGSTFLPGADPCAASWGVDDVSIELLTTPST